MHDKLLMIRIQRTKMRFFHYENSTEKTLIVTTWCWWNHKLMMRKKASTRFVKSMLPFACTWQRVEGEQNERAERKLWTATYVGKTWKYQRELQSLWSRMLKVYAFTRGGGVASMITSTSIQSLMLSRPLRPVSLLLLPLFIS